MKKGKSEAVGYHNQNLVESTARVVRGGSWKKQRVIMMLPVDDMISTRVMMHLMALAFPPNNAVHRHYQMGDEVGVAYSQAIEAFINHPELSKWEYLLTVESDNTPPSDGVIKLVERMEQHPEFACIGGLYWTKGIMGQPQIWGDPKDPVMNFRPQPPDPNGGLVECWGTGMGFNLWRLKMFKDARLRRPWFRTLQGHREEGGGQGTQDLYFWSDARNYGYRCAIDCSVKVGHYDREGKFGPPDTIW